MTDFDYALGGYLREQRRIKKLSQASVAQALCQDPATISRLERGETKASVEILLRYLDVIGADPIFAFSEISTFLDLPSDSPIWSKD